MMCRLLVVAILSAVLPACSDMERTNTKEEGKRKEGQGGQAGPRSPQPPQADRRPAERGELKDLVGKQVRLTGQFKGPGKWADYVVTDRGTVYLFSKRPDIPQPSLPYGTRVTATGLLKYSPPVGFGARPKDAPAPSPVPGYYYLENARIERLKERKGAGEKVPLPASPPPMQVTASMDGAGRLVLRMQVTEYQPEQITIKEGGKEKKVTVAKPIVRERTYRLNPRELRTYDARGQEIDPQRLPALLKREMLCLYLSAEKLDPLHLRLLKEGTLIFVYPPPKGEAPDSARPGRGGDRPVPGLAQFLKKQGYRAVPLEKLGIEGRLGVRVRVRGKELLLGLDTGASTCHLDRYRVRHLGLEWDDADVCDLGALEIGGLKTGPLRVSPFDLIESNRFLRAVNAPELDGLLGADVLRPLSAVTDHAGAVLYLRKPKPQK